MYFVKHFKCPNVKPDPFFDEYILSIIEEDPTYFKKLKHLIFSKEVKVDLLASIVKVSNKYLVDKDINERDFRLLNYDLIPFVLEKAGYVGRKNRLIFTQEIFTHIKELMVGCLKDIKSFNIIFDTYIDSRKIGIFSSEGDKEGVLEFLVEETIKVAQEEMDFSNFLDEDRPRDFQDFIFKLFCHSSSKGFKYLDKWVVLKNLLMDDFNRNLKKYVVSLGILVGDYRLDEREPGLKKYNYSFLEERFEQLFPDEKVDILEVLAKDCDVVWDEYPNFILDLQEAARNELEKLGNEDNEPG